MGEHFSITERTSPAKSVSSGKRIGIYFDLNDAEYHADSALGSGDMRRLARNPQSFWHESKLNPDRPDDKDTPARLRGRAVHTATLEGIPFFNAAYMRGPDNDDDMTPAEKAAETKRFKKLAKETGRVMIPAPDHDRITIASAMISKNPSLKTAFQNGRSEVSIFWERDGVRRKARLDYLKVRGVGDLKSIANPLDLPFDEACKVSFKRQRMDVQCAHYLEGRALIPQFVGEGLVFGDYDAGWLKKVAEQTEFAFQWIFFAAEGAPLTWSRTMTPGNPMIEEDGKSTLERAAKNYLQFMRDFGPDTPWLLIEEPSELTRDDFRFGYSVE